jgi:hypothetical protein
VIGEQITLVGGGGRARVDLITRRFFSPQLRLVEAKLGRHAQLSPGQARVYAEVARSGKATVRGRKGVRLLQGLGYDGSLRSGVALDDLLVFEQRFPLIEMILEPFL